MIYHGELSTVNRGVCTPAPCANGCQNPKISLLNSLLAGNFGVERGLLETASTTNNLNNLNWASVQRQSVCVIPRRFSAFGKGFHRCAPGFHADVTIPLQHLAADVSGN
jgi:hypothetical protein